MIEDFLTFLGEKRAAGNLSTVRPLDLQRFIDARFAKGHAASSAAIVRKVLGAYAGMRLGDAISLTWSNVDLANKTITFVPEKTSRGRRCKELVLPIHSTLLKHLNGLPGADREPTAPVIPGLSLRRIGGRSGLSRDFLVLVRIEDDARGDFKTAGVAHLNPSLSARLDQLRMSLRSREARWSSASCTSALGLLAEKIGAGSP